MSTEKALNIGKNRQNKRFPKRKKKMRRKSGPQGQHIRLNNKAQSTLQAPPNYPQPLKNIQPAEKISNAELLQYLQKLPESMVNALYQSTGGQPSRIPSFDRVLQLTVKALHQESRLQTSISELPANQLNALIVLVQSGGIAHSSELIEELINTLGNNKKDWENALQALGKMGIVAKSAVKDECFFYTIPAPLIPILESCLREHLTLAPFQHKDLQIQTTNTLPVPFDFLLISLATYINQHPPRLTQQLDIHKQDKEDIHKFFSQLWSSDQEIFDFCLHFLLDHGMLSFKTSELTIVREIMEEWLHLSKTDQNALVLAKLDDEFSLVEWLFWVLQTSKEEWWPERKLSPLYRRWIKGEKWRQRFYENDWSPEQNAKDLDSLSILWRLGFLEMAQWGQEKLYRLSVQGRSLISHKKSEEFDKFYLTPNFEIVAPIGSNAELLYIIGQLCQFSNCDRVNTYKITVESINNALENGWSREEILSFFQQKGQGGIPENVDFTLRKWLGKPVEGHFHNVLLFTVSKNQLKSFESNPAYKPYIVHRFAPGMYAIAPDKKQEFEKMLSQGDIHFSDFVTDYPQGEQQNKEKNALHELLEEAKQLRENLEELASPVTMEPEELFFIEDSKPPKQQQQFSPEKIRQICETAVLSHATVKMYYQTKDGDKKWMTVSAEKITQSPNGYSMLIGKLDSQPQPVGFAFPQIHKIEIL